MGAFEITITTHVGDNAAMVKHFLAAQWLPGGGLEILVTIPRILPNELRVLLLSRKQDCLSDKIDIDPKVALSVRVVNVTQQLAEAVAIGDEVEILVCKVVVQRINRSKEG